MGTRLGEETARWISVGNLLHKIAVISGFGAFSLGFILSDRRYLPLPLGITSLFCSTLYTMSWQFDPCSQYRVEKSKSHERKNKEITSKKAIVTLIRKNNVQVNSFSNYVSIHSVMGFLSFGFCYWKLSNQLNSQPDKAVVGIAANL